MELKSKQTELWRQIAAFPLDDPAASLPFTARLARENRWPLPFARRVADEYRRFLFLARLAGHPVTPSDQVDQAWHLHLLDSESYWEDLCRGVLGRPLHHGPTRGGAHESTKFHDWYARTLDSYRRLFGEAPPADIWPAPADRFGRDLRFARINLATHWVLPRPTTLLRAPTARLRSARAAIGNAPRPSPHPASRLARPSLAVLAVALVVLVGCRAAQAPVPPLPRPDPASMSGREFLAMFAPLTVAAVIASVMLRRRLGTQENRVADPEFDDQAEAVKDPSKLDPYALILLAHGPGRTAPAQAALARLVDEGLLTFDETEKRLSRGPTRTDRPLHPIEQEVLAAARDRPASAIVQATAQWSAVEGIEDQLRAMGWIQSMARARAMRLYPILLLGAAGLLGLWRIDLGLERGRPIGFLVLLCLVLLASAAIHLAARPWRTPRGRALISTLARHKPLMADDPPAPSDPLFPLAFALLGASALPDTGTLATLRRELLPPPDSGGGTCGVDGGASGCGGGGCGGGGCGGCGS